MAQANNHPTINRLSALCRDPLVRDAFLRAERSAGDDEAAVALIDHPPSLDSGAAERLAAPGTRRLLVLAE
jgi:hypothetical protein